MVAIARESRQYVTVPVFPDAGSPDPTLNPPTVAVALVGAEPSVFVTGSWVVGVTPPVAQVLVGPGSDIGQLDDGEYQVYVKVVADPESPVLLAGGVLTIV